MRGSIKSLATVRVRLSGVIEIVG